MIVISDNSALSALAELGLLDLLPILDEKRGRRVAEALGLSKTGTLGIIGDAAKQGWVDFDQVVSRLRSAEFHMADAVIDAVRKQLWRTATQVPCGRPDARRPHRPAGLRSPRPSVTSGTPASPSGLVIGVCSHSVTHDSAA